MKYLTSTVIRQQVNKKESPCMQVDIRGSAIKGDDDEKDYRDCISDIGIRWMWGSTKFNDNATQ